MHATPITCGRPSAAGLFMLTLAIVLAGCSSSTRPGPFVRPLLRTGQPVVVRMDSSTATAMLGTTPEARQFAVMLPLTLELKDVWGQAKSGPLPHSPSVEAARPVHRPVPGGIYFWPGAGVIAIYYDDPGQTVPDPGLVQLGVIETGLDALAGAGRRFTVSIERPAETVF